MSSIDIRNESEEVTEIIFSDEGNSYVVATKVERYVTDSIKIVDEDDRANVIIESKEHAENLIKAIQKAIELRWLM